MIKNDSKTEDFSVHGYHFSNCLRHALTKGVEDYAHDTKRRADFVDKNQHLFAGTMLVGIFSYLESTLGGSWISRCGGKQTRELECLRFIRNAFVHANSHIRDLSSYTDAQEHELRSFIDDLENKKITDDKGNIYPCYMALSNDGVVTLSKDAIQIFNAISKTISH